MAIIFAICVGTVYPGRAATSIFKLVVFAEIIAQAIQASQQAVATGTSAYSKPAASAVSATRSNSSMPGASQSASGPNRSKSP